MSKISLPEILQSEAAECGLACLAMIAHGHGNASGLRQLRERFPVSAKGMHLSRLIEIANALGLTARALRLELAHLDQLELPCVLHWDLNHFVVLERMRGRRATLIDPACGRRELEISEVSEHFTGIALELRPGRGFEQQRGGAGLSVLGMARAVRGLPSALVTILMLSIALQMFTLATPMYLQWVIDQAVIHADRHLLWLLGIGFGLLLLFQIATQFLRGWTLLFLANCLGQQWLSSVFAHVIRLPMAFFEKRQLGDITSRIDSVQTIQRTLTNSLLESILDGFMAIITTLMMCLYSGKLAVIALTAVLLYLSARALAYRRLQSATEGQLAADARYHSYLLETLRGMQSLKIAGAESHREAGYLGLLNDSVNCQVRLARMQLGFTSANQLIFGIERLLVIAIGAALVIDDAMSVGMLIAFLAYKDQFVQRISTLIDKAVDIRMLRLYAERLSDLVLCETEPEALAAERDECRAAAITLERVSFRYAEGEPWVIEQCSLAIAAGESIAITGPSGCGKTTLLKLMLGLLTPTSGRILVDGHELSGERMMAFRREVAAVMQDDQLFAGSIANNIAFGDATPDQQRIEQSARLAEIHDEVVLMPMAYQSLVGDMGSSLSGGQKQRVILARALYRRPHVLFLDEATSHLDVYRERRVNASIKALALTRVVIAHRPETIASADRIVELLEGAIVSDNKNQRSVTVCYDHSAAAS